MTTPGGVANLPAGALTLSTLSTNLEDMSGTAMKSRAVDRFPSIFNNSTGLNPALDITPFGILTRIWAEVNSLIANADPADIQGPDDLPDLLLEFIEGLPLIGQFVDLVEAILGTYEGDDETLLLIQSIFAPIRALVNVFEDIDTSSPEAFITSLIDALVNGGLDAVMDWAAIGQRLFGIGGLDETGVGSAGAQLMSLLGNPQLGGGSFNPITAGANMLRSVLTPAGALSTQTQVPAHLLGLFAPGNITNLLPDGGFDAPDSLAGNLLWEHDAAVGRTTPLGSARTTANGTIKRLIGVPIGASAGGSIELGTWATWTGLTATGNAIALCAQAYDLNGNLVSGSYSTVAWIASPPAASTSYTGAPLQQPPIPAHQSGWVRMTGTYECPAGTAFVRPCLEVRATATAGTVWFDDCSMMVSEGTGIIDAGWLGNWGGLGEGIIPGEKMNGIQGIANMLLAQQNTIDGLFNAWTGDSPVADVPLGNLFELGQTMAVNAFQALLLGFGNNAILANQTNKPAPTAGLQSSGESNFTPAAMPNGTTTPTTTLAAGNAIAGWVRIGQHSNKGFVDFVAQKPVSAPNTGYYLNLYQEDLTTGAKTRVWASPDIAATITAGTGTGIIPWVQVLIPDDVVVEPSQVLWAEIVAQSAPLTVGIRQIPVANHATARPKNYGGSRATAALGAQPTSMAESGMTYSGTAPMLSIGIAEVPADYHLPELWTQNTAGSNTYTIPVFARTAGATFDVTILGGGGGGQANYGTLTWYTGGNAGQFRTRQLVYGVDIPLGATSFTIYVGAKGESAGAYWNNGHAGESSYLQYNHPTLGTQTLTAPGGAGGGNGGTSGTNGKSPGTTMDTGGQTRFGGGEVGGNATGNPPGGGGGGAGPYQVGGDGAPGAAWVLASMPV